jgi:transcriptional regulator with XRE-family HTH domain
MAIRQTGRLWAIVQKWIDSMPYPPSQRKLAARLDVSPSLISDWKYRSGMPSPKHLRALAAEIGVPYERVLDAALIDRGYREDRGGPNGMPTNTSVGMSGRQDRPQAGDDGASQAERRAMRPQFCGTVE